MKFNDPAIKETIPHFLLFLIGILTLIYCYHLAGDVESTTPKEQMHVLRIFVAFGAAAISIALPGFIEVGNNALKAREAKANKALAYKAKEAGSDDSLDNIVYEPKSTMSLNVKAGGALAIFVLVYLVQPIGG
ncbi:hypothetical protein [Gilvibacter sediminis]|uniref:hypothetical protein n=1 Tax=Gilvibacter sediminis TaxID=379071 RepID=UPI002350BBA9|nr:hypothetical protein [Gilvibacter sediminis]MDC7999322.1 hypothetical protein [Gilvibacter sediminis]